MHLHWRVTGDAVRMRMGRAWKPLRVRGGGGCDLLRGQSVARESESLIVELEH